MALTPCRLNDEKYSTTEQVVGSWIDGTPIYKRTFYISSINQNKIVTVLEAGTLADRVVDYEISFQRSVSMYSLTCFFGSIGDYFSTIVETKITDGVQRLTLYLDTSWVLSALSNYYVTVWYTKTS